MTNYQDHFDQLHFTECTLGAIRVSNELVEIEVEQGLILLAGHPGFAEYGCSGPRSVLKFLQVRELSLKFTPYIGDPRNGDFGDSREEHKRFSTPGLESRTFELEGVTAVNPSWVDIHIIADGFELVPR